MSDIMYTSTKTYHNLGSVCYRQWRADSHCNKLHGYSLSFHFEFSSPTLDARNWVMDFGGLRPLKEKLEDWFDHTLLVAADDPQKKALLKLHEKNLAKVVEVERAGCEGLATFLMEYCNAILLPDYGAQHPICTRVEVRETPSNMAFVTRSPIEPQKQYMGDAVHKPFPSTTIKTPAELDLMPTSIIKS